MTPPPSLQPNRIVNRWGSQSQKLLEKGHKNIFPSRFTILRFEIVNVYRYACIQGQEIYDFTIFTDCHYLDFCCHISILILVVKYFLFRRIDADLYSIVHLHARGGIALFNHIGIILPVFDIKLYNLLLNVRPPHPSIFH